MGPIVEIGEVRGWIVSNNYQHLCAEAQAGLLRQWECHRGVLRAFLVAERMGMKSITGLKECGLATRRRDSGGCGMLGMTGQALEKPQNQKIGEWEGEAE
jgi:hypothetical protein